MLPAVLAIHEGCSASVASTATEITENLGLLTRKGRLERTFVFVLCAFDIVQSGKAGLILAEMSPNCPLLAQERSARNFPGGQGAE
jgi:predicted DNA-binding transcriptional regulator